MRLVEFKGQAISEKKEYEIYKHLHELLSKNGIDFKGTDLKIVVTIVERTNVIGNIMTIATNNLLAKQANEIIKNDHQLF